MCSKNRNIIQPLTSNVLQLRGAVLFFSFSFKLPILFQAQLLASPAMRQLCSGCVYVSMPMKPM